MRKISLLSLFIVYTLAGNPQTTTDDARYSLRAGFGYNLPFATGLQATNVDNGTSKGIYGSWGKGFIPSLDFSVRCYKGLHAVLGLGTLPGAAVKSSFSSVTETSSNNGTSKSKPWIPLILTVGGRYDIHLYNEDDVTADDIRSKFIPYVGFGVGTAILSRIKNTTNSIQTMGSQSTTTEIKSTTMFKPALAFYGEAGAKYMISKSLSVFLDVRLTSLSLMPKKQKITSEIINGKDVTSSLTTSQKETDFVKQLTLSQGSPDEPSQELAVKYPASGIAINCGISWNFGFGGKVMLGGPGPKVPPPATPKQGGPGSTREKPKAAAAIKACEDCPKTEVILTSNNDDKDFPKENTKNAISGPWGKSQLSNVEILEHEAVCENCKNSGTSCCCRLKKLKVKLTFEITFNPTSIDAGVWLNTNKDSKEYQKTLKGKTLPGNLKNPEDWKKVDKKSVEVHERQHCRDIKDAAKTIIDEELEKFPVENCVCGKNGEDWCKEIMVDRCNNLAKKLFEDLSKAMDKTSEDENAEYGKRPLEKKAREVQSEDLNNRPDK